MTKIKLNWKFIQKPKGGRRMNARTMKTVKTILKTLFTLLYILYITVIVITWNLLAFIMSVLGSLPQVFLLKNPMETAIGIYNGASQDMLTCEEINCVLKQIWNANDEKNTKE